MAQIYKSVLGVSWAVVLEKCLGCICGSGGRRPEPPAALAALPAPPTPLMEPHVDRSEGSVSIPLAMYNAFAERSQALAQERNAFAQTLRKTR